MRPETTTSAPAPRLFLITPRLTAADLGFAGRIEEALAAGDVASVLLRCEAGALDALTRRFAALAQRRDAAFLVEGDAEAALRAGSDGGHVSCEGEGWEAALAQAARTLKPDHILGAGGLVSRDDMMSAGECDIDYVLFGDSAAAGGESFEALLERVAWWAEIFTPPCVAYARNADEAAALAQAGADFIALGEEIWDAPADAVAAVARAALPRIVA